MSQSCKGVCPECEFEFESPPLEIGETITCSECLLTLLVQNVEKNTLSLRVVEVDLKDWGE